jgi:hypothetical protein
MLAGQGSADRRADLCDPLVDWAGRVNGSGNLITQFNTVATGVAEITHEHRACTTW